MILSGCKLFSIILWNIVKFCEILDDIGLFRVFLEDLYYFLSLNVTLEFLENNNIISVEKYKQLCTNFQKMPLQLLIQH